MDELEQLLERARTVAAAAGQHMVVFGVRTYSDAVFARCGDVECDGLSFASALDGVVAGLKEAAQAEASAAREVLERHERIAAL